jgi:hypothetical protein
MLELLTAPKTMRAAHVTGRWQVVRMCLDMAAQEWLNIGVLFRSSDGQRHWQLIKSMDGLRCLYDEDAVNNARFLLDQVSFAIEEDEIIPAAWNISLGPAQFVRGITAGEIVRSLFSRVVPLGKYQLSQDDKIDNEDIATPRRAFALPCATCFACT